MHEFLPILIVGAIIGVFTIAFVIAYMTIRKQKEAIGFDRNMADGELIVRLMKYAKPHWKAFVLVLFIMAVSIAYDIVSPLIIGRIEEMVKAKFELNELFVFVGLYAGVLIISLACTYLQSIILQKTGQKILSAVREDIFTHIESLSHNQLNRIPVGKLVI